MVLAARQQSLPLAPSGAEYSPHYDCDVYTAKADSLAEVDRLKIRLGKVINRHPLTPCHGTQRVRAIIHRDDRFWWIERKAGQKRSKPWQVEYIDGEFYK